MARPEVFIFKRQINGKVCEADFEESARSMMRTLGVDPGGRPVLMKPNVTAGSLRNSGVVTHPTFTGGLVDYFADDLGMPRSQIYVAETTSPATSPEQRDLGWARSGYTEMAREKQIQLLDLADYGNIRVVPGDTVHLHNLGVSRWAKSETVFYINLPKLKTHNLSVVTLCGKNQQGIQIPVVDRHLCSDAYKVTFGSNGKPGRDWMRVEDHEAWQRTIAHMHWDIYLACQPDFNIIEGIVGRDGTGFYTGRNFPTGLVVAGYDMPSVDFVGAYLMGYTVDTLVYLQAGVERGLCPPQLDDIDIQLVSEDNIERIRDITPYISETKFEAYLRIPADAYKDDLFEAYDEAADALQVSA